MLFVAIVCTRSKPTIVELSDLTVIYTGSRIGTMQGMLMSGVLCRYIGWKSIFYVFGKTWPTDRIFLSSVLSDGFSLMDKSVHVG